MHLSNNPKNDTKLVDLIITAIFSAISSVLMIFSFSLPFVPAFIKLDISELPALIISFAVGPINGVLVELTKNIITMLFAGSDFIGHLSNFIINAPFVLIAGVIYKQKKTQKIALLSLIIATITMAIWGTIVNYFVLIPLYSLIMPIDTILEMFKAIKPESNSLFELVFVTILPFNLLKGTLVSCVTFLIYKKISPLIRNIHRQV